VVVIGVGIIGLVSLLAVWYVGIDDVMVVDCFDSRFDFVRRLGVMYCV